jgi:transcription elongation factor Elf1
MIDKEELIHSVQQDAPRQPKCPKCQRSPLNFMCDVARTPAGHLVAVIWCANCGVTLQTQFVGMDQPQQPRILIPQ